MLCYNVIILIQILIRYNVKNLITACTRSLDFDLKIEKSPYPGRHSPRSVASLPRICHFSTRCSPPPNALTHGTPLIYTKFKSKPYYAHNAVTTYKNTYHIHTHHKHMLSIQCVPEKRKPINRVNFSENCNDLSEKVYIVTKFSLSSFF